MIKFYTLILALAYVIFVFANVDQELQELEKTLVKNLDLCVNKTKVTGAQLDDLARFIIPNEIPPTCFLACMAKNMNIMEENNKFSKNVIKKLMEPVQAKLQEREFENIGRKITDIINKCIDEQPEESDECAAAKKAMECVVANAKKAGLFD